MELCLWRVCIRCVSALLFKVLSKKCEILIDINSGSKQIQLDNFISYQTANHSNIRKSI